MDTREIEYILYSNKMMTLQRQSNFKSWRKMLWMVTLLVVSIAEPVSAQCGLCGSISEFPSQFSSFVPAVGKTCKDIYIDLSSTPLGATCNTMRNLAQDTCCGGPETTNDGPIEPARPNPNYVYPGPFGNEPICRLCGTTEYPGKPFEFIIARYVGEFSCDQLYYRGLNGVIDPTICGPLQDFAQSVCGCGIFNPACDPSKPKNQSNCFDPSNPNGPRPTPRPTRRPTPRPTPRPTARPTSGSGGSIDFGSFSAEDFAEFQAFLEFIASVDFSDVLNGFFTTSSRGGNRALRRRTLESPPSVVETKTTHEDNDEDESKKQPMFSTRPKQSES